MGGWQPADSTFRHHQRNVLESRRKALGSLSITIAPAAWPQQAHSLEIEPPAEASTRSTPMNDAALTACHRPGSPRSQQMFGQPSGASQQKRSSRIGKWRSASQLQQLLINGPVAPRIARQGTVGEFGEREVRRWFQGSGDRYGGGRNQWARARLRVLFASLWLRQDHGLRPGLWPDAFFPPPAPWKKMKKKKKKKKGGNGAGKPELEKSRMAEALVVAEARKGCKLKVALVLRNE